MQPTQCHVFQNSCPRRELHAIVSSLVEDIYSMVSLSRTFKKLYLIREHWFIFSWLVYENDLLSDHLSNHNNLIHADIVNPLQRLGPGPNECIYKVYIIESAETESTGA